MKRSGAGPSPALVVLVVLVTVGVLLLAAAGASVTTLLTANAHSGRKVADEEVLLGHDQGRSLCNRDLQHGGGVCLYFACCVLVYVGKRGIKTDWKRRDDVVLTKVAAATSQNTS